MAIFHPDEDMAPIHSAARTWRDRCLIGDGSLFADSDQVWTAEAARELDHDFVQQPDQGEGKFLEKLNQQLEGSSVTAKRLAAEMLWTLLLFHSQISAARKREIVGTIWSWTGERLDERHPLLAEGVLGGVGNPGQGYANNLWRELAWLVGFVRIVKNVDPAQRKELLEEPWKAGKLVDDIRGSGKRQFPHILRYLLHPEHYERIASVGHKRRILIALDDARPGEIREATDLQLDRGLYDLRQRLSAERGSDQFDFYQADLKDRWSPGNAGWLLSWNPSNWPWPDFDADRRSAIGGQEVRMTWRCGARGPRAGDPVFLVRTGSEPRGMIARGRVSRPGFMAPHYDAARAAAGEQAHMIEVAWQEIRDPSCDAFLSTRDLREQVSDTQQWAPQGSGIGIPADVVQSLLDAWAELAPQATEDVTASGVAEFDSAPLVGEAYTVEDAMEEVFLSREEFERILRVWRRKRNVVLQGAPGVGKSFLAKRLAWALMGARDSSRVQTVQFHQSYGYEDFVEGFRPTETGTFSLKRGVFSRFRDAAVRDPSRPYVFIIDEINRGNLSKIFGELMLLIERDKRGENHLVQLAYSREGDPGYFLPENLYLLGMMNTADRSLSLVDYALRRRFAFITLEPAFSSQAFAQTLSDRDVPPEEIERIVNGMNSLNAAIQADTTNLGAGFRIGHSFFTPDEDAPWSPDWYETIVETEIRPLLEEYWFDDLEKARGWVGRLLG